MSFPAHAAVGPGEQRAQRGAFAVLMFTAFVESLGSFLVLALLPFYAQRFGATATTVGWLVSAFALAQLVSAPLWGMLSDRLGRKPVLIVGLLVTIVSYWLFARADSLLALFVSRIAQGLGAGTVAVVFAYIADLLPEQRRTEGVGWITAATSGAAMIGPIFGSVAARFDPSLPGYGALVLALVATVLVAVFLPTTARGPVRAEQYRRARGVLMGASALYRALAAVVRRPGAAGPRLIWTYAVGMLATSATFGVIGLYLEQRMGIDESSIWWFFSILAGASLIIRLWLLGPAVRRFGEPRLMVAGCCFLGLATLALIGPKTMTGLVPAILLFALGQSLLYPSTTSMLSSVAQREDALLLGQTMGVQQTFGGTSRVVGPILGGWIFARVAPQAPFVIFGLVVLLWGAVLALRQPAEVDPDRVA